MVNPKLTPIKVDGKEYGIMFQDYGEFIRLNVYQDGKVLGRRDFPRNVDQENNAITYFIRRMVGGCGPIGQILKKKQSVG